MKSSIRAAIGIVATALILAIPSSASAAKQCIFEGVKVSAKNRDRVERSLFCLTNLHRVRSGVPVLHIDRRLSRAARSHSEDMVNRGYFDHFTPEGAGPSARAAGFGYPFGAGENIATNFQGTAAELFEQWLKSPGHNQNMLSPNYPAAGMGVAPRCCPGFGGPGVTGTQMFGIGPANTRDDAFNYYANSNKCAKAKVGLIKKRESRRKARKKGKKVKAKKLGAQIRELKKLAKKRCKDPPGS